MMRMRTYLSVTLNTIHFLIIIIAYEILLFQTMSIFTIKMEFSFDLRRNLKKKYFTIKWNIMTIPFHLYAKQHAYLLVDSILIQIMCITIPICMRNRKEWTSNSIYFRRSRARRVERCKMLAMFIAKYKHGTGNCT